MSSFLAAVKVKLVKVLVTSTLGSKDYSQKYGLPTNGDSYAHNLKEKKEQRKPLIYHLYLFLKKKYVLVIVMLSEVYLEK